MLGTGVNNKESGQVVRRGAKKYGTDAENAGTEAKKDIYIIHIVYRALMVM